MTQQEYETVDLFLVECMQNVVRLGLSPHDCMIFRNTCAFQREIAAESILRDVPSYPLNMTKILEKIK